MLSLLNKSKRVNKDIKIFFDSIQTSIDIVRNTKITVCYTQKFKQLKRK